MASYPVVKVIANGKARKRFADVINAYDGNINDDGADPRTRAIIVDYKVGNETRGTGGVAAVYDSKSRSLVVLAAAGHSGTLREDGRKMVFEVE